MKIKPIQEIMTSKVCSVSSGVSASEAIEIMRKEKISCLFVIKSKKTVGMFTEGDIVQSVHRGISFNTMKIDDLVSTPVITANPDIDIHEAYNIISTNKIKHLAIVNSKGKIIGIVTQTDIIKGLGPEYFVEFKKVSKIMTRNVQSVKKDQSVCEAICKMAEASISCIIVEEKKRPMGIFTERDVTRLLYMGDDLKKLKIEDVMSRPVVTVDMEDSMHIAAKVMNQKNIRRIVVTNRDGKVEGLITQFDLIQGLETDYIEFLKAVISKKDEKPLEACKSLEEKSISL